MSSEDVMMPKIKEYPKSDYSVVWIGLIPLHFRRLGFKILALKLALNPINWFLLVPEVKLKENEPFDVALRRFKRSCEKAGILAEVRRREFYEKPTSVRKRKAAAAVKRHLKKLQRENRKSQRLY